MTEGVHWSSPVTVADLPPEGVDIELVPDEAVRADLARHVGVLGVPALSARFKVTPEGRAGARVEGRLDATVRQMCVVTLDPFDNQISEVIAVRFAPAAAGDRHTRAIEVGEEDPPDTLVDGVLDLALLATEFLALAIDPYPRKPGAVFEAPAETQPEADPRFAALARLKPALKREG